MTPGRVTVLFGRNGSGKSTLLRIIAGDLRADWGAVHCNGDVHLRPRLASLARRGLYYLQQEPVLPDTFRVGEILRLAAGGPVPAEDPLLVRLGIGGLMDARFPQLSGGEARRAAVAAAILRRPRWLLADEPLTGVTPADQELIGTVLRELASRGTGVLVTGHEVPPLMGLADEVVWCVAGTTHYLGDPGTAMANPRFAREYLGMQ